MDKSIGNVLALILVIVGGINWGLVGFFDYNLVGELFGSDSGFSRTIYALVGLAAIYLLIPLTGSKKSAATTP